jgi:hypothetical protein
VRNSVPRVIPKSNLSLFPARQRFLNWHGVPEARKYRHKSVHGQRTRRSLLTKILSPILFFAPDLYLRTIVQETWVDGLVHRPIWVESIKKLNEEWQGLTLLVSEHISVIVEHGLPFSQAN